MESYAAVRRFVFVEGHSRREAARMFRLNRETVAKMCRFSLPPGYTRTRPVTKPKLGPLLPVIDDILTADQSAAVKQRHSVKRIFERLRDERGFAGGYKTCEEARQDVFDHIEMFYNPVRKHVRNGMLSPVEFGRQQALNAQGV